MLDPYEMAAGFGREIFALEPATLGVFFRLLPYVMFGSHPLDMKALARYARVHVATFKKAWPAMADLFFDVTPDAFTLKRSEWLSVQIITGERRALRHLLNQLVEFWGNACVYCGAEDGQLQVEHITPLVRGGTNNLSNLTVSCQACNSKKRTKTAAEFGYPAIHDTALRIQ